MATLLVIDSSARSERSHTRALTRLFAERWHALRPQDEVLRRDVGLAPPPPVDACWIAAAFTPPAERTVEMRDALALSDAIVDELERADVWVLGAPMYNFGMPAQLKAYVDQLVRVGRTFAFDPQDRAQPYRPLLHRKTLVLLTSRGDRGYGPGGALAHLNHLDGHVDTVFRFVGAERVESIAVESDEYGDGELARSRAAAGLAVERLVARLVDELHAGEPRQQRA